MNNLLTLLNEYIEKTEDECNSVKKLSKIWKIYFCFFIGLNLWLLPTSTFALDTLWNKTLSESDCSGNAADCDWFNDTNWNNNQPNANINQTTINTGGTTIISGNREANGGQTLVLDDLPGVSDNFSKVILQNGSLVSGSVNIFSATGFIQNGGTNTVTNTLTINGFGSPSYALNDGILIANNIHLVDGNFNQQGGLVFGNVQTDPGTQFVINGRGFEGDIINNGQILFESINDQILKSNISGSGNLLLNTLGKVTLTGNNTYNGGTFIENGTLNVSSESSLGTGDLSITGGTLQISGTSFNSLSRNIVVSQDSFGINIVDKGNIFKINQDLSVLETTCEVEHTCSGFTIGGLGTLVLSGNNTYFGGTNLNSGTLSVSSESNLGQITSSLNFNGGILQITGTNFNSTSRTINWGAGGGGFDIADSSNIFRLNQNIGPGGNLIKRGGGTLVLNGTNTYTGGTTVNAGNLQVGDDTHLDARIGGPVTVNSTGILSGHGTITGDVFNNGTLSPGGSIGTLNVQGNVRFTPNSLFNVEINPNQASLLNVSGFASLNNANVSILADPGTYTPRTYTILNAAGGVRGTFANLNLTNPISNPSLALLTPTLQFLPNRVDLSLGQVVDPMGALSHVNRHLARERNRIVSGRLNAPLGINCAENRFGFWARGLGMLSYADASGNAPKYEGGTGGGDHGV
jgi:autotransporter-associated beta strand protein